MTKAINPSDLTTRKLMILMESFKASESVPARLRAAATLVEILEQVLTSEAPSQSKDLTFEDGIQTVIALIRSGADVEAIAAVLPADLAAVNREEYQDHLRSLRAIMQTDGLFSGATS